MRFFKLWMVSLLPLTGFFYLTGLLLRDGYYLIGTACLLAGAVAIGLILHRDEKGGS